VRPDAVARLSGAVALPVGWRERAALFRAHADEPLARAYEACARELEAALAAADDSRLTLEQAAEESHYSADHLRRLVHHGKLPCSRKGRQLFFRAGDLPRRPPRVVDAKAGGAYDPAADARKVAGARAER
jgi:hypothetical protein